MGGWGVDGGGGILRGGEEVGKMGHGTTLSGGRVVSGGNGTTLSGGWRSGGATLRIGTDLGFGFGLQVCASHIESVWLLEGAPVRTCYECPC